MSLALADLEFFSMAVFGNFVLLAAGGLLALFMAVLIIGTIRDRLGL